MSYKLTADSTVIRTSDGAFIPDDPGNRDRQEYVAWLETGGVPAVADQPDLASVQAAALAEIDRLGGEQRLLYITAIPGQDGTYIAKQDEARAWVAAGSPTTDLQGFSYAAAEAALTGDTIDQTLAVYKQQSDALNAINAQIEAVRISKKREVNAAADAATVEAILAELVWPQP